jgi:cation diffusion facilitator CzcD-associated flavoprotein CzcO
MTAHRHQVIKDSADGSPLEVVVIGGGQAGLAMAWHLAQRGLRFVALEDAGVVVWATRRPPRLRLDPHPGGGA